MILTIFIKSVLTLVLLILCKCIKNLYGIYTIYPKKSVHAGHIAWGILSEATLIIMIFIKLVKW